MRIQGIIPKFRKSERNQEIISLYYKGKKQVEIAKIMGISIERVSQIIKRGF